jgi:hypothetical protein
MRFSIPRLPRRGGRLDQLAGGLPDEIEIPANLPDLVARYGGAVVAPPLVAANGSGSVTPVSLRN